MNSYYKMLVSAYGLSTFSEGILIPIYAIFVQRIGGGILEASGAVAVYFILQGLTEIWIHKLQWSNRHRMYLMIFGWFLWLVGILSYLLVNSVFMLFVAQILTALGNAVANPAFDAELSDKTDAKIKEYEYSVFEGIQDIVQGIAAILGGLVATVFGFKILIIMMAVTATLSFFMILRYRQFKYRIRNGN